MGPGVYDNDKTSIMYKMTKKQTGWTIGKDKRINFAGRLWDYLLEREAKRKGFVPGSGQYQDVNQTKIYKKMNQTFSFWLTIIKIIRVPAVAILSANTLYQAPPWSHASSTGSE